MKRELRGRVRSVAHVVIFFVAGAAVMGAGIALAPAASADSSPAALMVGRGSVHYRSPVDAPVADPFRMDNGPFGAGNRGLEYRTTGGEQVLATAPGRVVFVGEVVGRLVVTLRHGDGRLSSVTNLSAVLVEVDQLVLGGDIIGHAAPGLHFGIREEGRYVDPAQLLDDGRRVGAAYLVPLRSDAAERRRSRITRLIPAVPGTGVGSRSDH